MRHVSAVPTSISPLPTPTHSQSLLAHLGNGGGPVCPCLLRARVQAGLTGKQHEGLHEHADVRPLGWPHLLVQRHDEQHRRPKALEVQVHRGCAARAVVARHAHDAVHLVAEGAAVVHVARAVVFPLPHLGRVDWVPLDRSARRGVNDHGGVGGGRWAAAGAPLLRTAWRRSWPRRSPPARRASSARGRRPSRAARCRRTEPARLAPAASRCLAGGPPRR